MVSQSLQVELIFNAQLAGHSQGLLAGFVWTYHGQQTRAQGSVADQAALFGVLKLIRDLNLPLVAFRVLNQ